MNDRRFTERDCETLYELLLHRRDVRGNRFVEKEISDKDLSLILQAASLSPSVGFSQPWEFVVVKNTHTRKEIARIFEDENQKALRQFSSEKAQKYALLKLEGIRASAVNLAVFYTPRDTPVLGQTSMPEAGEYSVVCAIQNMWLMSRARNIGMGWVSILDQEKVKKTLNAPHKNKLIAYLCLGHVDQFLQKPELELHGWEKKIEIDSKVTYEKYA